VWPISTCLHKHLYYCICYFIAGTLYGPMHNQQGVDSYLTAIEEAKAQGGKIECGGKVFITTATFLYVLLSKISLKLERGGGMVMKILFLKQKNILTHVASMAIAVMIIFVLLSV